MSTICAEYKHKMSLARPVLGWQLRRMGIGRRIAEARTAARISQIKLGELVGAGQTTISSWERERTEPTREDVQRIAAALGVPVTQLEIGEANDRNRRTVPVVGYVGAGAQAHFYATGDGELDRVEAPDYATERTVAAAIRGESLGPLLEHFLVFWDDVRSPVTEDLYHQLCVVGLPDDRILVKMIKPAGTPGRFHLLSNNEGPMLDEEIIWAAKVTGMRPR